MRIMRVLVLVGGLCLAAIGLLGCTAGILAGVLDPTADRLTLVTVSVAFLGLAAGFGLILAWQAWLAIHGQSSKAFQPRRIWVWAVAFVLVLAIGQVILSFDLLPVATFPFFYVAGAVLPPWLVVAFVGLGLRGSTRWRDVILQMASGALLSTLLAFILELALIMVLVVVVFVGVALQPGGPELISSLADHLQNLAGLGSLDGLASLARSPLIVAAVLIVVAGAVPLIEEAVKALGVAFRAYRRPGRAEAFLWGVASGAGFAMAEALFNGAGAITTWAPVALLRAGTTILHCFTGGMMGLAWYSLFVRRRWGWGLGLYAASVAVHGSWNALTAGTSLLSLNAMGGTTAGSGQVAASLAVTAMFALLIALALAIGLGMLGLTLYLRRLQPAEGIDSHASTDGE